MPLLSFCSRTQFTSFFSAKNLRASASCLAARRSSPGGDIKDMRSSADNARYQAETSPASALRFLNARYSRATSALKSRKTNKCIATTRIHVVAGGGPSSVLACRWSRRTFSSRSFD